MLQVVQTLTYPTPEFLCFVKGDESEIIGMIETALFGTSLDGAKERATVGLMVEWPRPFNNCRLSGFPIYRQAPIAQSMYDRDWAKSIVRCLTNFHWPTKSGLGSTNRMFRTPSAAPSCTVISCRKPALRLLGIGARRRGALDR
ncbi:MAG: hypothetical protein KDA42_10685 [Planctomycetales bacterium]|nr:hypothetical protein [Planctomycetales bacterium]